MSQMRPQYHGNVPFHLQTRSGEHLQFLLHEAATIKTVRVKNKSSQHTEKIVGKVVQKNLLAGIDEAADRGPLARAKVTN